MSWQNGSDGHIAQLHRLLQGTDKEEHIFARSDERQNIDDRFSSFHLHRANFYVYMHIRKIFSYDIITLFTNFFDVIAFLFPIFPDDRHTHTFSYSLTDIVNTFSLFLASSNYDFFSRESN